MKWEEVEKRDKGEWVFVEVTKANEDYDVLEAEVLCHHPDEDVLFRKAKNFSRKSLRFGT